MTDAEISRRLALAIGWREEQIIDYAGQEYIGLPVYINGPVIKLFSYRFPSVIWPIAERYNCFPMASPGGWCAYFDCSDTMATADTAAKAVALAVIKAHEGAKE